MVPTDLRLIRRAIDEVWNAEDLDVADELFAARYINHGGLITDLVRGPEAIKISVVLHHRAFPRLHIGIDELIAAGGMAVLHWRARWLPLTTLTADEAPAEDADTSAGFSGVMRLWAEDGQIQESWTEWDQMALARFIKVTLDAEDAPTDVV